MNFLPLLTMNTLFTFDCYFTDDFLLVSFTLFILFHSFKYGCFWVIFSVWMRWRWTTAEHTHSGSGRYWLINLHPISSELILSLSCVHYPQSVNTLGQWEVFTLTFWVTAAYGMDDTWKSYHVLHVCMYVFACTFVCLCRVLESPRVHYDGFHVVKDVLECEE